MPQPRPRSHRRRLPSRFFLTAGAIVALAHAYIGMRLLPDIGTAPKSTALAILLLVASSLLIPAGLMARRWPGRSKRRWAIVIAWAGLLATGFFSSLFVATLARDVLLTVAFFALADGPLITLAQYSAFAVPMLALVATAIGFINARRTPQVREVAVVVNGLPPALDGLAITQLSDIHVGPTIGRAYLERIIDRCNALSSDLIAITGDLVDGSVDDLAPSVAPLSRLSARHGTYFVTGNHEYYSGASAWVAELRRLGITVLQNEHVVLEHRGSMLVLAGVTDYSAHLFDAAQRSDPKAALRGAPAAALKILLAHQPRSASAAAAAGFDLQLSGHTHGGQFFPWNFFVRLQQPYTAGLHRHDAMAIYISRGTGYWGPPKRLGAPSEITRLRLVAAPPLRTLSTSERRPPC